MPRPTLSRSLLLSDTWRGRAGLGVPSSALFDLPEKVVQFGTGAFLRGFIDAFIDDANRCERFGGRIVAVGSTESGRDARINEQDGLFTLIVQGLQGGAPYKDERIIASVSRALSAVNAWDAVLACARQPALTLIVSNTTEVGIVLDDGDRPDLSPPRSFPGKLTRFLFERARFFAFAPSKGVAVLPCELIENNGDRLRSVVLELAERWQLGSAFARWIELAVPFCNALVDRIVPGVPAPSDAEQIAHSLGYDDAMLTLCEPYRLLAVEADARARALLPFTGDEAGIVFADDIAAYRKRKVGLLNATHTLMVPVALGCGCCTVSEALSHERVGAFVRQVMFEEIVPTLDAPDAEAFALQALDRFGNPFIRHFLSDIALQATMKFRVRVVPLIARFVASTGTAPRALAFGLAAHLYFVQPDRRAAMIRSGLTLPVDNLGARLEALWLSVGDDARGPRAVAMAACADDELWGCDLARLAGFADAVADDLTHMVSGGVPAALEAFHASGADTALPQS